MTNRRHPPAIKPARLRQLLHRLIDIYSPSGKEEKLLAYLHGYLRRHGLPVLQQSLDGNRYNLLVMPPDVEPELVLFGHVDTVMAYELMDFGYEEREDLVIGLGSADMKGGCAAMIEAFLTLWESGAPKPPVALALVVGEEEEGDGTQKLLREFHFPWAIIGEPTDLKVCLSHYGYLEVQITTQGRRMHASLANQAHHPVEAMLKLLLKITRYISVERPQMVYNIREVSSSQAGFAVPEQCNAWLDIHLPPTSPLGEITMEIEEILLLERRDNPNLHGSLRFTTIHAGYSLPEKGPLVQTLKEIHVAHSIPWDPQAFPSHSDANLLWAAGMKPILLGPGQLEMAHTRDESISFKQVVQAAQIYHDLLISFCV